MSCLGTSGSPAQVPQAAQSAASPEPGEPAAAGRTPDGQTAFVFVGSTGGAIRAFVFDPSDGSLAPAGSTNVGADLGFVALAPDDRTLFAASKGTITALTYEPKSASFTTIGAQETAGGGTHVAVSPSGTDVLVAHYRAGAVTHLRFEDGRLGAPQIHRPGDNAHQIRFNPTGTRVYVPCLGSNHVAQFDLAPQGGLSPSDPASVPAAGGPRHMAFHPSLPLAYVLGEKASLISTLEVDSAGALLPTTAEPIFTSRDEQYHWSADVRLTPDGRHLYATNREPPALVRFAVSDAGELSRLGATELSSPVRAFGLDPAGYLLAGGQDGSLVSFRIDQETGDLQPTSEMRDLGEIKVTLVRYLK